MTAVAIYTRLSHDRTGQQTATHRQQAACQAFAQLRGWRVARVFEDVVLSAFRRGVVRPAYEEMLLAIQSKCIDGVVAWLTGSVRDLVPGGDHVIGVAEVRSVGTPGGEPLVYFHGGYHVIAEEPV